MAKILVIEDEPDLRATICEMLSELGHYSVAAGDGRAGAEIVAADRPDLVICDIFMPEHEGLATITRLPRSHPRLPILAITGRDQFYLNAAQKLGAIAGLKKPFGIDQLQGSVDQLLRVPAG